MTISENGRFSGSIQRGDWLSRRTFALNGRLLEGILRQPGLGEIVRLHRYDTLLSSDALPSLLKIALFYAPKNTTTASTALNPSLPQPASFKPATSPLSTTNNNRANQRIQAAEADGGYWKYRYDDLVQLSSARKQGYFAIL